MAREIPIEDFAASGFAEVWLGDFSGIRRGMHYEIELMGLFPEACRLFAQRPSFDSKPFG